MSTITIHPPGPSTAPVGGFTPDDLFRLENEGLFELVDGQLIKKPMGFLSGRTVTQINTKLGTFLEQHPIGAISLEATFRCFPKKPNQVRRPDLSFIANARLAGGGHPTGMGV